MWYIFGMDNLNRTLAELSVVRAQLARGVYYRGYRAVVVLCTGVVAVAAARLQPLLVAPDRPRLFVLYWAAVAMVNIAIAATAALAAGRNGDRLSQQQTISVFGAAVATLAAGALATVGITLARPDAIALLPGLWCLFFAVGIFATLSYLPRAIGWSGVWYFAAGMALLLASDSQLPLRPWGMGFSFGVGQILGAILFYFCLERNNHEQEN